MDEVIDDLIQAFHPDKPVRMLQPLHNIARLHA